jgi:hypothetical protein
MKYLINKLIQFKQWFLSIVKCRFFLYKKTFHFQPFIYLDEDGLVLSGEIGNRMKWLDNSYIIKAYCSEKARKIAEQKVSKIYKGDLDDVWYF